MVGISAFGNMALSMETSLAEELFSFRGDANDPNQRKGGAVMIWLLYLCSLKIGCTPDLATFDSKRKCVGSGSYVVAHDKINNEKRYNDYFCIKVKKGAVR
jgi:hypothetical protein